MLENNIHSSLLNTTTTTNKLLSICNNYNVTKNTLEEICFNYNINNSYSNTSSQTITNYNYSINEKILMAIITGGSNIFILPIILKIIRYRNNFEVLISLLGFIGSLMYHVCESLQVDIYMEEKQWHVIDNIGTVAAFNLLIIDLINTTKKVKDKLNVFSLFIIFLTQFSDPWNIINSISPIFVFIIIYLYFNFYQNNNNNNNNSYNKKIRNVNNINIYSSNRKYIYISFILMPVGILCFIIGLDNYNDYLRIYHSFWHIIMGYSTFYIKYMYHDSSYFDYYSDYIFKKSYNIDIIVDYLNEV